MKRLFDYDPYTGIKEVFEATDDGFLIHTTQDVEPFIEHNKKLQGSGKDYWKSGGEWRHEATIPIGVQYHWLTKYGIDVWDPNHKDAVTKLLNDPDWRYLKTAEIII